MFDRHQAEITVMQFRGHSLLVHQSMSVSFRQQNPPMRFLSITGHWNVSLPFGASLWNGMFGRVEGQYTTMIVLQRFAIFFSYDEQSEIISRRVGDAKLIKSPGLIICSGSQYVKFELDFQTLSARASNFCQQY